MTLGRRILIQLLVAIVPLIAVTVIGLLGLSRLNQKLAASLDEYEQLRWGYEAGLKIASAREAIRLSGGGGQEAARQNLYSVLIRLDEIERGEVTPGPRVSLDPAFAARFHARLSAALEVVARGEAAEAAMAELNGALSLISGQSRQTRQRIVTLEAEAQAERARLRWIIIAGSLAAMAVMVILGLLHYRAVMLPIGRLTAGARRLAGGDLRQRVSTGGDRELHALADDFNRMADRLQTLYDSLEDKVREQSVQLARSERLAAVGLLAAGVAHEVNNPLGIIAGQAELAQRQLQQVNGDAAESLPARLDVITQEAFRCKAITERLMSLARPSPAAHQRVDLLEVVEEVRALMEGEAKRRGCELRCTLPEAANVAILGHAAELKQVLVNLLLNAVAASEGGTGEVELTLTSRDQVAMLCVIDRGAGMDADTLARVFEPFFTTKRGVRQPGAGLGLSVSLMIVEEHGGKLTATSDGPGRGSCFTMELPLVARQNDETADERKSTRIEEGSEPWNADAT